jgi:hypothetical protein
MSADNASSFTVIELNPGKKSADNTYAKLEIPVSLPKAPCAAPQADAPFCSTKVNQMQ